MTLLNVEVVVLCFAVALLLTFAVRLRQRLQTGEDFILGRRRLTASLGGIAVAANGVPIWWLILLIGAAYASGRAAVWPAMALIAGVALCGWSLAPRLRSRAHMQRFGTVTEVLADDAGEKMFALLMRSAAVIIVTTLVLALAAQLQLAASFLGDALGMSPPSVIVAIVLVLGLLLLLSGFWIAAFGDVLQLALFVGAGAICGVALLIANWRADASTAALSSDWFGGQHGLLIISYLVGIAFLIGAAAGQTPLLGRFMACKDDADLNRARHRALLATCCTSLLALGLGWGARALNGSDAPSINTFRDALLRALPANLAAILVVLVQIAFVVAMIDGLHAAASHLANDLRRNSAPLSLLRCRFGLLLAAGLAAALALFMPLASPTENFDRMLFCWHALGASFGPLLIVRLAGKRVRPGSTLGAMWSGFLLTLVFHLMPDTPGELLERALPFTAALGIALSGGERRRNPDRADRGERTIHDRLPI